MKRLTDKERFAFASEQMETLNLSRLSREKAREKIVTLPRNKGYILYVLSDGRRIFIRTDGTKKSRVDGKEVKEQIDITVHYDGEKSGLSYIDDVLVDITKKNVVIGEELTRELLKAVKDAIELHPIPEILQRPQIAELTKRALPGESIEFLLAILMGLALQEDINYWGINPKTKKRYEGREKPYNALYDLFVKNQRLRNVLRAHQLLYA
jgi:hypothetical protein